jgi:hypothetical protein
VVYRNEPASPFYGAYIFADYQLNKLQAFKINAAKTGVTELKSISGTPPGRISAMGQDAAGNIYVATYLENPATSRTHVYRLKHAELKPATVSIARPVIVSSLALEAARRDGRVFTLDGKAARRKDGPRERGLLLVRDPVTGKVGKWVGEGSGPARKFRSDILENPKNP